MTHPPFDARKTKHANFLTLSARMNNRHVHVFISATDHHILFNTTCSKLADTKTSVTAGAPRLPCTTTLGQSNQMMKRLKA